MSSALDFLSAEARAELEQLVSKIVEERLAEHERDNGVRPESPRRP